MKFLEFLGIKQDRRPQVYTPIDNTVAQQNRALLQELVTLKAQLSKESALRNRDKDVKTHEEKEQKVIKELNEQNRKIKKDQIGDTVSLVKFILNEARLSKNGRIKWKKPIELTDKDDSETFGLLGDIQISTKTGYMLLRDQYMNPMSYSPRFNGIVYKPESFGNQLKRRRILLPKTKDFKPVIDLDEIEINDVVYNPDEVQTDDIGNPILDEEGQPKKGVYSETMNYRRKFKELLEKRDEELREKDEYVERLEVAQLNQRKELGDLKRAISNYKNLNNSTESRLTEVNNTQMQLIANLGDYQKKLANLQELKSMYEKKLDTYESMYNKSLDKIEELGGKTSREIIEEEWKAKMDWAKSVLPETVNIESTPEIKEPQIAQPGQTIGQRRNV